MGLITIDYRDRKLIYEQLVDNVKLLVLRGDLKKNDFLPSVQSLAKELGINPNTIQKAYNELENEGYIYSVPGKGSFASGDIKEDEKRKEELKRQIRELVVELRFLGVTQEELDSLLQQGEEDAT